MKRISLSRRFLPVSRLLLALFLTFISSAAVRSQTVTEPAAAPVTAESRIQRARALIAAHQLLIAASELENVRASTQDASIRNITSVMLMSIYLEEGNYTRAEALLEENFRSRSGQNSDSIRTYFALAGQAVNGSRTHLARYRSFGVNVTDPTLPAEVVTDLDRLRSFVERMIGQAKQISSESEGSDSLSLLEDVLGVRLSLAKDSEDQLKWEGDYASARQTLASSRTQIAALRGISALPPTKAALNKTPSPSPYSTRKTSESGPDKPAAGSEQQHTSKDAIAPQQTKTEAPTASTAGSSTTTTEPSAGPVSLNARATKRVVPRYPPLAKQSGTVGTVRVYLVIDERGAVVEISRIEGPFLLRQAAEDAARKWRFEATPAATTPVRISGFLDFSFAL